MSDGTFSLIGRSLFFSERKDGTLRLCIPNILVDEILQLCHNTRGHPGLRRTFTSVALRFYFPKMSRRIKKYIYDCSECQTSKPSTEAPAGLLQPVETPELHHSLGLDYITGLPPSHGYDAMLTVTDLHSKAVKLIPCHKSTTAEETANLFFKHCYTTFGLPTRLVSDRDARFTSKFWATLMNSLALNWELRRPFIRRQTGKANVPTKQSKQPYAAFSEATSDDTKNG